MVREQFRRYLSRGRGDAVDGSPDGSGAQGGLLRPGLHLVALWAFAVAQPLFDLIGRNAVFLVAHRASWLDVLVVVLLLTLGGPAVMLTVVVLVGRVSTRAENALHLVFVGLLLAAISLPVLNRLLPLPGLLWVVYLLVVAGALATAYASSRQFRQALTFLSASVLLFAGYFLFGTPVSGLVLPTASAGGGGSVTEASRVPVVMILFDELPIASLMTTEGDIDGDRFPNMARLAQRSTWYRNATVVHPSTRFSVPSILTGAHASSSLPIPSEYPRNLFSMLEDSHRLDVWESVTELCRQEGCERQETAPGDDARSRLAVMLDDISIMYLHMVLPPGWREGLPSTDQQWAHFRAQEGAAHDDRPVEDVEDVEDEDIDRESEAAAVKERFHDALGQDQSARVREFIDGVRLRVQPSLHYLHVMLPHRPLRYMPSGRVYESAPAPGKDPDRHEYWGPSEYLVAQIQQRHLLQVRHVDALVGELLDAMERERLLEDSLVVITADHGIGFEPGRPWRRLVRHNARAVVNVPLFIKLPGQQEAVVDDRNVEVTDVLPTIADALSVEVDWEFDGRSLLEPGPVRGDSKHVTHLDEEFVFPGDLLGEVLDVVARRDGRFGPYGGEFDLLGTGPHADLVGRSLDEVTVAAESDLAGQLEGAERFLDLDPGSAVWPNRLIGRMSRIGSHERPVQLAASVNGVIAGVGQTYEHQDGAESLSIVTHDGLFVAGSNDVRLFEIRGSAGQETLHEIGFTAVEDR